MYTFFSLASVYVLPMVGTTRVYLNATTAISYFFIHRQNTMNLLDGVLLTHCRPVTIFSLISIECNDMQLVNSHSQ